MNNVSEIINSSSVTTRKKKRYLLSESRASLGQEKGSKSVVLLKVARKQWTL